MMTNVDLSTDGYLLDNFTFSDGSLVSGHVQVNSPGSKNFFSKKIISIVCFYNYINMTAKVDGPMLIILHTYGGLVSGQV